MYPGWAQGGCKNPFQLPWHGRGQKSHESHTSICPNIVRIIHLELGPWRHLKWHLNMTNDKICFAPGLYKPLGCKTSCKLAYIKNYSRHNHSNWYRTPCISETCTITLSNRWYQIANREFLCTYRPQNVLYSFLDLLKWRPYLSPRQLRNNNSIYTFDS